MSESIFTIYKDKRFERIQYYFKEQDIITLDDLKHFNFDELQFVPGISEKLISEAKQLFSLCSISSLTSDEKSGTEERIYKDTFFFPESIVKAEPDLHKDGDDKLSQQTQKLKDALITEVYGKVPRSAPFISKCNTDGKFYMSQLSKADFENAVNLHGLGITTVENLKIIYFEFFNSELCETLNDADPISYLPLSIRAKNCLEQAGITTIEEVLYIDAAELLKIKNMGIRTVQEILDFRKTASIPESVPSRLYNLKNVALENMSIPICLLHNLGISRYRLDLLSKKNMFTVSDLYEKELTLQEYSSLRIANNYLSIPVTQHFIKATESQKDNTKICMSMRSNGATLEEIGNEIHVTRERVRQILANTCRNLRGTAELVAGVLLSSDKMSFSYSDLVQLFNSHETAMYCKLVLQGSEYVRYFKFSDSFINIDACGTDIEARLKEYTDNIIGEGINFYDNLEEIDSELKKHNLDFFDAVDIMNFLIHNGYRFYGDYVTKKGATYSLICHDVVLKYFKFDIKLDSNEENSDMRKLRQIIAKYYKGVSLPSNNRALTAGMTRDPSKLILSGRGRYCPIEKIVFSVSLFEEVHNFIIGSSQNSFYYSELFSHFQGRFLAETNIDNPHFLHGMLKCLYPDEFMYERDLLSKVSELRQDIDDRLNQILLDNGNAMTKAEIKQAVPGIDDYVIAFSVMRLPKVIQWDYNEFNHIDNISITQEEKTILLDAIRVQTELHNGYSSDVLLFSTVKDILNGFLYRNNIVNSSNLYYVVAHLFEKDYIFKRPHILSKDFPIQEISTVNIAQIMLQCEKDLNYDEYWKLATEIGWAGGTVSATFYDLEKDFIRISKNDYIRKKYFCVSQKMISLLNELLGQLVYRTGYFALASIFEYELFPECSYRWNGFLLESLINEYDVGFRIISPQLKDRRYQRGIIVLNDSPFENFEDLVIGTLTSEGIARLTEAELLKYLKIRGLIITNAIPQELYDCPKMPLKNELFIINK